MEIDVFQQVRTHIPQDHASRTGAQGVRGTRQRPRTRRRRRRLHALRHARGQHRRRRHSPHPAPSPAVPLPTRRPRERMLGCRCAALLPAARVRRSTCRHPHKLLHQPLNDHPAPRPKHPRHLHRPHHRRRHPSRSPLRREERLGRHRHPRLRPRRRGDRPDGPGRPVRAARAEYGARPRGDGGARARARSCAGTRRGLRPSGGPSRGGA
jgi:hypothetical protein